MATYEDRMRGVDRRRQLAELLQMQAMQPQGQQAGRFYVGPSAASSLVGLASALRGGYLNRKAEKEEKSAREDERQRLTESMDRILRGNSDPGVDPITGQGPGMNAAPDPRMQAAREAIGSMPLDVQQKVLGQQALKTLFPPEKKQVSPFAKVDPKDYTSDSVTKFATTGNFADLVPRKKFSVSGGEVYDPEAVEPGQMIGRPPAGTTVNVNTAKSLYETIGDNRGKAISDMYDQATKAPELLNRAQRVKALLGPNSAAITGAGADQLLALSKVAAQLGFNTGDAAADTEMLSRELSSATLDMIRHSGLGGGNGFSNADREFLQKAAGGQISMEAASLVRLADLNERAALATIEKWNATAGRLDPEQLRTLGMAPIEMPAGTPAPAAKPKLQQRSDGTWVYTP